MESQYSVEEAVKGHSVSLFGPSGPRDTCPQQEEDGLAHFLPVILVLFPVACWSALFKTLLEDVKLIYISPKVKM